MFSHYIYKHKSREKLTEIDPILREIRDFDELPPLSTKLWWPCCTQRVNEDNVGDMPWHNSDYIIRMVNDLMIDNLNQYYVSSDNEIHPFTSSLSTNYSMTIFSLDWELSLGLWLRVSPDWFVSLIFDPRFGNWNTLSPIWEYYFWACQGCWFRNYCWIFVF